MDSSESNFQAVLELAEEFLDRYRNGERPSLKEYLERYPGLAAEIKDALPPKIWSRFNGSRTTGRER